MGRELCNVHFLSFARGHMVFIEAQLHQLMAAKGYAPRLRCISLTGVMSFVTRVKSRRRGPSAVEYVELTAIKWMRKQKGERVCSQSTLQT